MTFHPLTIVCTALCAALLSAAYQPLGAITGISLMLLVSVAAERFRRFAVRVVKLALPLAAFVVLMTLAVNGFTSFTEYDEIINQFTRILALVSAATFISVALDLRSLQLTLLASTRFPRIAPLLCVTTLVVPEVRAALERVTDAQRARGVDIGTSLWNRTRHLPTFLFPVIISAMWDNDLRNVPLTMLGVFEKRPRPMATWYVSPDSAPQSTMRWVLLLVAVGITVRSCAK